MDRRALFRVQGKGRSIKMSSTLEKLQSFLQKMEQYNRVITLLYWDMETTTPKNGFEGQTEALTYFSTEEFRLSTSEELSLLLDRLSEEQEYAQLDEQWKFIVKRMKKDVDKRKKIPEDLYAGFVREQAQAGNAWQEAKKSSDFSIFAPHLEKLIEMTKEMTAYTDPGKEIYDVLLDNYEEGMNSEIIDELFDSLKEKLSPLVKKIIAAKQPDDSKFKQYFNPDDQRKVQKMLLEYIGFSFDSGAVSETEHPFTLNFSSKDVRVTNHYFEHDAISAMFSAIHEGGHAIFEQNVNPLFDGTIAGSCCYMGIHESQSRFYENILGRNKNFWIPVYGKLRELLPQFQDISLDEFYQEINHVRNSFIRTEADELTYCFHIILRYEMEKAIFRDHVSVDQLPALWNQKMKDYLDITPTNDAEGILQDMHWSDGSFGYFPSYLLGSIYDGMFLEEIEKEFGDINVILREGRIQEITKWLNEKIHQYGSTRTPKEVIHAVCGREVSAEPLIHYFTEKYTKVYDL